MKKRLQGIIIGVLVCAVLFSVSVLAAGNSKMIEAFYTGIRLFVDGGEYIPTDANGKVVEPFIYNGTTYLPVRAVANAFGKDVIWDGANQTVYLGKKDQNQPDAYLSNLMYTDYREGASGSWLGIINGNVQDYNGKTYTSGLIMGLQSAYNSDPWCEIDYPLNCQYEKLTGTIVLPKSYTISSGSGNPRVRETSVSICDVDTGSELFRINGVVETLPYKFEINVKGVNKITVKVNTAAHNENACVALTDLALYE
ncbi:MAG: copper amine oxidase N-terminal domain-containing protein [Ruminococcaceae bacterium]|nr:copper amine oxidase N-terminal domain-containing protein [Oscillospiraceae bacterium]